MTDRISRIYGRRAVEEYLRSGGSAKIRKMILCSTNQKQINDHFTILGDQQRIPLEIAAPPRFAELAGQGKSSQGVLLEVIKKVKKEKGVTGYMESRREESADLIVMLDHISDTQNLGSILRLCGFFGAGLVIAPRDRSAGFSPAVEKIAAGALAHVEYCRVANLAQTIRDLKENDYWIIGTSLSVRAQNVNGFKFPGRAVLVIGNEHKGLSTLIEKNCDHLISIPGGGPLQSLNAAVSSGILLYLYRSAVPLKAGGN